MKRIIVITSFYLSLAACSFGQADSTNFEKLLVEFSQQYIYAGRAASTNFLAQLFEATNFTLNIENPNFAKTKSDFTVLSSVKNEDSVLIKIADSIYGRFVKDLFWEDQRVDLIRFGTLLSLYNERICACLTPKLNTTYRLSDMTNIVLSCDSATMADAPFMSRLNPEIKKIPLNERQKVQWYAGKYFYQHCPEYYKAWNQPMFNSVIGNHKGFIRQIYLDLEEKVIALYTTNKTDSLRMIFPDYSMYKKDIETSVASIKAKLDYTFTGPDRERTKDDPELFKRTLTFYREGKKTVLLGQIVSTYRIENLTLKVKSFQYITADNIKNKEEVLSYIDIEPPPPPVEELREMPVPKKKN